MKFGRYQVSTLLTSNFSLDGGSMFGVIPKNIWQKKMAPDVQNRVPLVTRSVLIRDEKKIILLDTGNGEKWDNKMQKILNIRPSETNLPTALAKYSLTPNDVTDVICTHLHFDHAGGNTCLEENKIVPMFPNATYHLHQDNWNWANSPTEKDQGSYRAENWKVIAENGMFNFLKEDQELFEDIECRLTYGHTSGQMHPLLLGDNSTLFFGGDLFPTRLHFRLPCIMAFDNEPLKSLEEKKKILAQASEEGWIIVLAHDPEWEAVRVLQDDHRFQIKKEVILE